MMSGANRDKIAYTATFRNSLPTTTPAWEVWFNNTFGDHKNDLLVFCVYKTLRATVEKKDDYGKGFNLSKTHLLKYLHEKQIPSFIKKLCEALNEPIPDYIFDPTGKKKGLARELFIRDAAKAKELLATWHSFVIKPKKKESKLRKKAEMEVNFIHPCRDILNYLNNIDHKFDFSGAKDYVENQLEVFRTIGDDANANLFTIYKNDLLEAEQNSINGHVYLKGDAYRVYITGNSLQNINSALRRMITPRNSFRGKGGYLEIDLKSAHLAIVAGILKLEKVQELLAGGKDVYDEIGKAIGVDRKRIKDCLIRALYGAQKLTLAACLIENDLFRAMALAEIEANRFGGAHAFIEGKTESLYNKLVANPIFAEIKEALKRFNPKDHKDAFGFDLPEDEKTGMRFLCESYEKKLLLPIYNEAFENSSLQIVLDQHDGLTVWTETPGTTFNHVNKLVKDEAEQCGIITRLTIKN